MRALAADVQRLLAEDLLVAASAVSTQDAAQAAVQQLLGAVVRELGALAGVCISRHVRAEQQLCQSSTARRTMSRKQHCSLGAARLADGVTKVSIEGDISIGA